MTRQLENHTIKSNLLSNEKDILFDAIKFFDASLIDFYQFINQEEDHKFQESTQKIESAYQIISTKYANSEKMKMENYIHSFKDIFTSTHLLLLSQGLSDTSGREGDFQKYTHSIEEKIRQLQLNETLSFLFLLQRYKKDFVYSQEPRYIEMFDKGIKDLQGSLAKNQIPEEAYKEIQNNILAYQNTFKEYSKVTFNVKNELSRLRELEKQFRAYTADLMHFLKDREEEIIKNSQKQLEIQKISQVIISIASLGISLWAWFFLQKFFRPLQQIIRAMENISAKNLVLQFNELHAKTEVDVLVNAFFHFFKDFKELIQGVQKKSSELSQQVSILDKDSQNTMQNSSLQAAGIREVVSTLEDNDKLMKIVENKIGDVSNSAQQVDKEVTQGSVLLQDQINQMEQIRSSNNETLEKIKALGESINSIWEVVNIISSIAGQTKIIAFNAEIEASSAGDAGKSFQIVATEIRRLADSTVISTDKIKQKIEEIQQSSDVLVTISDKSSVKIESGYDISKKLQDVFVKIQTSSSYSASSSNEINTLIKQQASASEQILITMKQLSEGTNHFVDLSKNTKESSLKISHVAENISSISRSYTT